MANNATICKDINDYIDTTLQLKLKRLWRASV